MKKSLSPAGIKHVKNARKATDDAASTKNKY